MPSNVSGNRGQYIKESGGQNSKSNSGRTAIKHSAVNNPVPGKGEKGSDKGGKK